MTEVFTPVATLKRRIVGMREWKVSIEELIESERAGIAAWRSIKGRHPADAVTLGYCVDGLAEAASVGYALWALGQ